MSYATANFTFQSNYEVEAAKPLDNRFVTPQFSHLTSNPWTPYIGMLCYVSEDSDATKRGLYALTASPSTTAGNWEKVGNLTVSDLYSLLGVDQTSTNDDFLRKDGTFATVDLSGKHPTIDSSARLNANLINDGTVSNTEFGYLNGVTSGIQSQLNNITFPTTHTFTQIEFDDGNRQEEEDHPTDRHFYSASSSSTPQVDVRTASAGMGVGLSASSSGGKLEATGLSNYIDLTIASKGVGEVYVHTDSTKRMTVQGDGKVSIGNVGEITSSETLYVAGSVNLVSGSSYQVNGVNILSNIPQSAITNLSTDLGNKQDVLTFGNAAGNAMKVGNNAIAQDSFVRRGSAGHFYGSSVSATKTALDIKTATFVIHCEESHGVNPNDTNGFQWSWGNGDTNNYGLALPCRCKLRRYAISTEKSLQFMFQVYKFTNKATLPTAGTLGIEDGANCYGYLGSAAHAGAGTFRKTATSTHNSGTQTALDIQYNDDGVQELDFNAGDRIALCTEFLMNPTTEFNNFGARITLQFEYVSDT